MRKSLNERVEAIGHRQSVRRRRRKEKEGGEGGQEGGCTAGRKQPTQKELFTVQTLFPSTLLCSLHLRLVLTHWRARARLRALVFSSGPLSLSPPPPQALINSLSLSLSLDAARGRQTILTFPFWAVETIMSLSNTSENKCFHFLEIV